MTKTVLVTGAGGFIGGTVARQARARGDRVLGLFHSTGASTVADRSVFDRVGHCELTADQILDFAGSVDEIQHCAGSGSVPLSLEDPVSDFNNNVLTTRGVLEYARRAGGIPVVIPSSAGVYGAVQTMPIAIDAACNPISPYGYSKLISELLARQYAAQFGVPVAIVRLFSVYGPGLRKQLLWDASRKIVSGQMTFFGTGAETRDWLHVADAARLLLQAGSCCGTEAPTMNGGTGQAVTIRQVLETLALALGVRDPIAFNGAVRPGDPKGFQADVTEATRIGWAPTIALDDGLAGYAAWFQSEGSGTRPAARRPDTGDAP